jgi:hypothetical protein
MKTTIEKFDRANNQGRNHDIKGNVANVDNETLKPEDDDSEKQQEIPTVTPDNDNEELENPQPENASNKGQGPAGENL